MGRTRCRSFDCGTSRSRVKRLGFRLPLETRTEEHPSSAKPSRGPILRYKSGKIQPRNVHTKESEHVSFKRVSRSRFAVGFSPSSNQETNVVERQANDHHDHVGALDFNPETSTQPECNKGWFVCNRASDPAIQVGKRTDIHIQAHLTEPSAQRTHRSQTIR